ncbi:MAG: polyprenyl synthetase family protein [Alphaproteobacteria bacterium]|nr:polyprenyl synthetase family protein [Alphaproteobacteria bacterium]
MQRPSAQRDKLPAPSSPLDHLSAVLERDMRQVNERILKCMESDVPLIPQLARYLIAAGGKRIRPLLTLAGAAIYGAPMPKTYPLAAAVEFIHTATLLHDDVVDESAERRGQKAANLIFGNKASVLVGDYLFSKSFQLMVECDSLEVLAILSDAAAVIAQGEVKQLTTSNNIETSLPAYLDVVRSKTAALFAASCQIGPVLTEADEKQVQAMRDYGMKIGIAFQIVDDMLDYTADSKILGKEIGDDFKEGKMTAPVIFAVENADVRERSFWQRTIEEKIIAEGDFEAALELMERHDALKKSRILAETYIAEARQAASVIPEHPLRETLSDLADFILTRTH